MRFNSLFTAGFAVCLLSAPWAAVAQPAPYPSQTDPSQADPSAPRHGGAMGGFLTPEQRAVYIMNNRDQLKSMTDDERHAWRRDQMQKLMAMSGPERDRMRAELQAQFDALPQGQKDRIEQRIAKHEQGGPPGRQQGPMDQSQAFPR